MLRLGISPEYVLERMTFYEIRALLDRADWHDREAWERARTIAYVTAQVNATKRIEAKDIIEFPWDGEAVEKDTRLSEADRLRLTAIATNMEKHLQHRNDGN